MVTRAHLLRAFMVNPRVDAGVNRRSGVATNYGCVGRYQIEKEHHESSVHYSDCLRGKQTRNRTSPTRNQPGLFETLRTLSRRQVR